MTFEQIISLAAQMVATGVIVFAGIWKFTDRLITRIDEAKDCATAAKNASSQTRAAMEGHINTLDQKLDGFAEVCRAHRENLGGRVKRLEQLTNGGNREK